MEIRAFQADDGMLLKRVRLRTLQDAPYAFGGPQTFNEESALPDSHWHRLAAEVGGQVPAWRDRCVSYVVLDSAGEPRGTASSFLCSRVPRRAWFSAAWVDPRCRRQGIGRRLLEMAMAWAAAHGADHLRLWVDDTNPAAARFYRALGFQPTGESRPVSPNSWDRESSFELRLAVQ